MKQKILAFLIFSLCLLYADNNSINFKVQTYRLDKLTNKKRIVSSINNSWNLDEIVKVKIIDAGRISSSNDCEFSNLKNSLDNYRNYNDNLQTKVLIHAPKYYNKQMLVTIKPVFNSDNSINNIVFEIQKFSKLGKYGKNVFDIKTAILDTTELINSNNFNQTQNGKLLNKYLDDEKNIYLLISEDESEISFAKFSLDIIKYQKDIIKTKNDLSQNLNDYFPKNLTKIEIPYKFDVQYKNSIKTKKVMENIQNSQTFEFIIGEKQNSDTKTVYKLSGKLYPTDFKKNKISIFGIFSFNEEVLNKSGNKSKTNFNRIFNKTITLNTDDVIEIKLPEIWQEKDFTHSKKDKKIKHSIFLKPVK